MKSYLGGDRIKRRFLLILLLAFLLCACTEAPPVFPEYTETELHCTVELTVDGAPYTLAISRAPLVEGAITDATVTVLAPAELAGLSLVLTPGTAHLVAGDVAIPVLREDMGGFLTVLACFSLRGEEIVGMQSVSTEPDRTAVTYQSSHGLFTVLYDEALIPLAMDVTYRGHVYRVDKLSFSQSKN
ncbi:MAG: hypothetical protein J6D21_05190 [Clostridia bacterium]|nr:hypothetical protein [Clostridia bacterium]